MNDVLEKMGPGMKILHIYSTADGHSHFEDLEVEVAGQANGDDAAAPALNVPAGQFSPVWPARDVQFLDAGDGHFDRGFHHPRRRQLVIMLTGSAEFESSVGEVRVCGPGSVIFAEDVDGRGHVSRSVDTERRTMVFVHLD